jgi:hypothetical protein
LISGQIFLTRLFLLTFMSTEEFRYDDEIVDDEELEDEDTNIYGEPEGLSEGYGLPVDGSTYLEDDEEGDYDDEGGYLSNITDKIGPGYTEAAWASAGGAAGGALMFGMPEAALLFGGTAGAAHLAGQGAAKAMERIGDYLDGDAEEEEASDEQYATA